MFNDSYLRACMELWIVQKIRFSLLESGRTKAWCPGFVSRPSAKAQEPVATNRGFVIYPQKLSVGAYFELSFLGCGFLIHLSNRSDRPRLSSTVEEDTSKIQDTTGTVFIQGPSIVLPVARSRGLVIQPPKLSVGAYFELSFLGCGFLIHLSNRSDSP